MNKKIIFVILIIIFFLTLTIKSYALEEITNGIKEFKNLQNKQNTIDFNELEETSNTIYNTFQIIGIIVAAIVIIILGIQFMVGTIEEKAKIKESLIPLTIGLLIIFGAFTIWKIIVDLMQNSV